MIEELDRRFQPILDSFMASAPIQRAMSGELTSAEYRSILKEIFHYTRENPQMQALATVYFRGNHRRLVAPFLKHAADEIGHEYLALNDFETLGGDPTNVPYENPLPATSALIAYGFYHIYNLSHLGHLGYIYFLEKLPVLSGEEIMKEMRSPDITEGSLTFLRDHSEIDIEHTKLMEQFLPVLVSDDRDFDCIEYSMKTTAYLFEAMLTQAITVANDQSHSAGWNWEELNADNLVPPLHQKEAEVA